MKWKFKKRSANQLLKLHMILWSPWIVLAFAFHGPFAIIGFIYGPLAWAFLNHLNRAAWKKHFRPKHSGLAALENDSTATLKP
jgi:hypothetical protein